MDTGPDERIRDDHASAGHAVTRVMDVARAVPPGSISDIVEVVAEVLGAVRGRVYVADYALRVSKHSIVMARSMIHTSSKAPWPAVCSRRAS